ncbi:hypothetical protein EZV62_022760 [Acer yangbiense]|uniref:Cullin neddylation domain-containing protein n=1 Tax=Acer yangbiense TaxID=1000413 RepID=A0A5C7H1P9_9ROSI|nr:hypothetical protein EZV62_022760 [Acer yangbiense]
MSILLVVSVSSFAGCDFSISVSVLWRIVSKLVMITLPPVDERKKIVEDADKDRRYAVDAAIVCIMKIRIPDIKAITKRMADLIGRDYLERDKENPNTFS